MADDRIPITYVLDPKTGDIHRKRGKGNEEIEDKIVGPLTLRQFIYVGGAAGLCVVFFSSFSFFFATKRDGSQSFTSHAVFTANAAGSNSVIGPAPLAPASAAAQDSAAL